MADVAQLGIQVSSQGVDKAIRELRQLEQVGQRAGIVADQLSGQASGVSRSFSDMERSASAASATIGRMFGISVAAALTTFAAGVKKAKDQILEIAKLSEDTRLGPGLVSGLMAGARGSGASESEITSALRKFSEVSKKAKDDAESFYKAMSNVSPGLATAFQNAGSQEERLRLISDALRNTTDEVKRLQLAQEAFGTDAERVLRVLGAGSDEINKFIGAARSMGMAVDQDMIQRAREADKALADLGNVVSGNLRMALADLAPAIAIAAQGLASLTAAARDAFQQIGAAIRLGAQALATAQTASGAGDTPGPDGLTRAQRAQRLRDAIRGHGQGTPMMSGIQMPAGDNPWEGGVSISAPWQTNITTPSTPLPTSRPNNIGAAAAFRPRPSLSGGGGGDDDAKKASTFDRALRQMQERNALAQKELETMGLSTAQREAALAYERALNVAKRDGETLSAEQLQKLREQSDEYGRIQAALEEAKRRMRELKELSDFAKSTVSGLFTDMLSGIQQGKGVWESFAQAAVNALNKIATKLMDMAINNLWQAAFPASGGGGGLFGSLLGGLIGGLGGGGDKFAIKSAHGNVFYGGNVVPFARGGVVGGPTAFPMSGGRTGLMGEAGAEAIMPLRRTANGDLGIIAANSNRPQTVNITVNVEGANGDQHVIDLVKQGVQAGMSQVQGNIIPTVREGIRRGAIR